jgi:hypothetical protein
MPSTFTTSGVELIADGEQSGLWGQTTNVNLQIIDRMTSQAGTITLSGTTHTLTVSNGVLSDGQYGVLVFSGSPSGTNTVTISPNTAQRTFFVRNTTSQSVVLSQGSGANVTVPTNTSKIVYTNGAGAGATVVDITNTVATNVLGNLTGNVTGNVTGNAGTATTLQTARTIGGVSFDGSANINLPGVNQAGNQNTTGSAATLTTARAINGTNFDGSANITTANWGTARTIWGQSINGSADITAPVLPAAGSVTAPAFSTSGDTDTGIYFSSANVMNVSTGGALAATFAANGDFTAVGNVTAFSDARLKTNLQQITDALAKVQSLTGYTYTRIDTGVRQTGVVAQEVQKVLPEAVSDTGDHLAVAYGNMIGLLIEAIKELSGRVKELEAR